VALYHAAERERGRRSPGAGAKVAQPLLGEDGVLVLADHVLEALRLRDEPSRRLTDCILRELGGVPGTLPLDSQR
jgi:hypothetical protein